jgi:hypothetical protein
MVMELPVSLHVEGEPSPWHATFVPYNPYVRWKDSLNLLIIGIQRANSTPKCMEIPVPILVYLVTSKRES